MENIVYDENKTYFVYHGNEKKYRLKFDKAYKKWASYNGEELEDIVMYDKNIEHLTELLETYDFNVCFANAREYTIR